jgi:peptidoglycan/xylan/chitin deacetylase (PgdA/CDA1 family)
MYHYVRVPPEDADRYGKDLSVTPENFRAQMEYLVANGYTALDLYDLARIVVKAQPLPARAVIITADDGYRDFYENGYPVLRELGLRATLFLVTDFVDRGNPQYVSWDMVREMAANGIRMEPHSKTHLDLSGRTHDQLVWQILGSLQTIEAHIGYRPRFFSYPGGTYDEAVIEVLRELDFWGAVTTAGGTWHGFDDRYEWARMRVRNTTTMPLFIDILE